MAEPYLKAPCENTAQTDLRNEIIGLVTSRARRDGLDVIQAATACFGALAGILAVMTPSAREHLTSVFIDALPRHTARRAEQFAKLDAPDAS